MSDNKKMVNIRIKNALCYVPLAAFFIHFTDVSKSNELKKHIKYWIVLFLWYAILNVVLWVFLWKLLFIIYLWFSLYLWYKAYNWEDIYLSFIDDLMNNKTEKNKKDSSDKDDDVLNF